MQNKFGVGGICVPYVITKRSRGFGTYLRSYRPPLENGEVRANSSVNMMFNRPDKGAFTINFGGNENSFTAEIPQSGYKLSFNADGINNLKQLPSMGFGLK